MPQREVLEPKKAKGGVVITPAAPDSRQVAAESKRELGGRASLPSPAFHLLGHTIKVCVAALTLGIWFIVGFVFWIPLLARATTSFTVSATYSNLVARGVHIPNAGLEHATLFYVDGFRSIIGSIFAPPLSEPIHTEFRASRFLLEIGWALLFWWATLLAFSSLGVILTPYSDTFLSLPWLWDQVSQLWLPNGEPGVDGRTLLD